METINVNISSNVGTATNGMREYRKEINELRSKLIQLDETSEEYASTLSELANKQFKLREMNEQVRYSATDLGEQLSTVNRVATGIASGFEAAGAAVTLFGGDSEQLEKTMVKLQSAIALVQGLEGLEGLGKDLKRAKTQFAGVISSVKKFTGSLSGIQKGLIATGIGAFVVLIGSLIANWDKLTAKFKANDNINRLTNDVEKLGDRFEQLDEDIEFDVRMAEAAGATKLEIIEMRRELAKLKVEEADAAVNSARLALENMSLWDRTFNKRKYKENLDAVLELQRVAVEGLNKINQEATIAYTEAQNKGNVTQSNTGTSGQSNEPTPDGDTVVTEDDTTSKLTEKLQLERDIITSDYDRRIEALKQYNEYVELTEKESIDERLSRILQFNEDVYNEEQAKLEAERLYLEQELALYDEGTKERIAIEQKLTENLDEEKNKRIEFTRQQIEAEKDAAKEKQDLMFTTLSNTSSILNSLASMAGDNIEQQKALSRASIIINGIEAGIKSFNSLGGWPWGMVGIASTLAAVGAQLVNLENMTLGDTSGGDDTNPTTEINSITPPDVTASLLPSSVVATALTGQSTVNLQDNLSNLKVYVTETDISDTQDAIKTIVQESDF